MKKIISTPLAITVIVVLAILIGGIIFWQFFGILGKETTSKDETSDWKTYRNEKYGFEFKYPSEWNFIKDNTEFNEEISGNNSISLNISVSNSSVDYAPEITDQYLSLMIMNTELIDEATSEILVSSTVCSDSSEFGEEIVSKTVKGCKYMNMREFSDGSGGYNPRNMWNGHFNVKNNRYVYGFHYLAGVKVVNAVDIFNKIISTIKLFEVEKSVADEDDYVDPFGSKEKTSPDGKYFVMDYGISPTRTKIVYNNETGEIVISFMTYSDHYIWLNNNEIVFTDLQEVDEMRPWGEGEGTGIAIINLNGQKRILLRATNTEDYRLKEVFDYGSIGFSITRVESSEDWLSPENQTIDYGEIDKFGNRLQI